MMLSITSKLPKFAAARSSSAALFSQSRSYRAADASNDENHPKFFPVYVHHVSKIVLEYLQESKSDWLLQKGLDRGLNVSPNGTFALHFPARKGFDSGRIWTSYDSAKKQHWISVYRQKLAVRFLLKDHGKCMETTMVHDAQRSERRIRASVDHMITAIDQMEAERSSS